MTITMLTSCRREKFLVLLAAALSACSGADTSRDGAAGEAAASSGSPNARWEIVEALRADREAERHPSDGGGRAWIEPGPDGSPPRATVSSPGRWSVVYETGPLGIAEGGLVYLQVSPFWGWSTPQVLAPDAPGFTTVETDAEGVSLSAETVDQNLLAVTIEGRALREGDRVTLVYGAGPAGALADLYAERCSRLWIAVDGDGDGVRRNLEDSPCVDVGPGPPARLLLFLPTTARPGETVRLTAAVLDGAGNAGIPFEGEISLAGLGPVLRGQASIRIRPEDRGSATVEMTAVGSGVARVMGETAGGLRAESNPLVVREGIESVLWGDLQIHSNLSDGTGRPAELYAYARDVAALDVAAVTDHDHWGLLFLDDHPALWDEIREALATFHEPGRFVTLLGYEWTSWSHGHRHVLFPGEAGEVLSSVDPRFDTPGELWEGLRGTGALTVAHHTAGEPVATDWEAAPDPGLESVVEVVSVHGSSEAHDTPLPVAGGRDGHWVRDALARGYRYGLVGSGDGHDGHPGLAHLNSRTGGIAALVGARHDRASVLETLRARSTYATSGPRIWLRAALDGRPMGSALRASEASGRLELEIVAPSPLARVDVVRGDRVVESIEGEGRRELRLERTLGGLAPGELVYARVIQDNGGLAFTSPFFLD